MSQARIFPLLSRLEEAVVVAVIRGTSAEDAARAARAVARGGIKAVEVAFTTPEAPRAIAILRKQHPELLVGAGTVLETTMLDDAIAAGAQFSMSPHVNLSLIEAALERNHLYLPGAFTPTEVVSAYRAGAPAVKVFPAATLGPEYVKALLAPLPQIPLVTTGGVSSDNLSDWLDAGALAVGAGGSLVRGTEQDMEASARAFCRALEAYRSRS